VNISKSQVLYFSITRLFGMKRFSKYVSFVFTNL